MGCYPNWMKPSPRLPGTFKAVGWLVLSGLVPAGLWFKQPPDLFPLQRFPFEQRYFDSFTRYCAVLKVRLLYLTPLLGFGLSRLLQPAVSVRNTSRLPVPTVGRSR
jgi:hypothetical protein